MQIKAYLADQILPVSSWEPFNIPPSPAY